MQIIGLGVSQRLARDRGLGSQMSLIWRVMGRDRQEENQENINNTTARSLARFQTRLRT